MLFIVSCTNSGNSSQVGNVADTVSDGSGAACLGMYNFRTGESAKYEVTDSNQKTRSLNILVTDVEGRWTSFVIHDEGSEHNVHLPQGCGPFVNDAQFFESNIFNGYQGDIQVEALIGRTLLPTSDRIEDGFEPLTTLTCGEFENAVAILNELHEIERCNTVYENDAGESIEVNSTLTTFSGSTSEQWIVSQVHTHSQDGDSFQLSLTDFTLVNRN